MPRPSRLLCPPWTWVSLIAVAFLCSGGSTRGDDEFESKVRPVLAERCWKCHGTAKQSSGLRLDSREALLKGGAEGPAIIPGKPSESLLVKVLHRPSDLEMPPVGAPLDDATVGHISSWIQRGAPWPTSARPEPSQDPKTSHWAFRPPKAQPMPEVSRTDWVKSPIDAFILRRLDLEGISPSPPTDKRTLIRRATFDLVGLPPSEDDIEDFLADESPDAFARVVNRLLDSPHYGERWGRHWLDVARYADTKGYVFTAERRYPYSYTYRDYIVRSFNEDLPYDQFLLQQLAADKLPLGEDKRALAALGFLTVGRRFLNDQNDIIDDRIDVVSRGLLGLTVACARCHDHKFDPIPSADYYSLHGVFASSVEPAELPMIGVGGALFDQFQREHQKLGEELKAFYNVKREEIRKEISGNMAAYLEAAKAIDWKPRDSRLDSTARERQLKPERLRFVALVGQPTPATSHDLKAPMLQVYQSLKSLNLDDSSRVLNRLERDQANRLKAKIAALEVSHPGAPARAMVLNDSAQPVEPRVFLRGNPGRPGPVVPRRFLAVLSPKERTPFANGSGRLDLAREIIRPDNPLTARVLVNRVWQQHFGAGLVRTPSDFGFRGDPPTHPELLDDLAIRFVQGGWSIKQLHRLIMLSSTYQQASDLRPGLTERDPQNLLLARQNRRRLEFESIRDTILAVSGRLDLSMGGQPVDLAKPEGERRRTLYGFIDRQNLDALYRTFDFPKPDSSTPRRVSTTVPQQALFFLNSPFLAEQSRHLARLVPAPALDQPQAIEAAARQLTQRLFGRPARDRELALAGEFLKEQAESFASEPSSPGRLSPWEAYCQTLLMTNELITVD